MVKLDIIKMKYGDTETQYHLDMYEHEFILKKILHSKGMLPSLKISFVRRFENGNLTVHEIIDKIKFYAED